MTLLERPTLETGPAPPLAGARSFGLATFVTLCGLVPLLVLSGSHQHWATVSGWITLGILIYSGARISQLITHGEPRLLIGVFWLFVYVAMGTAPLAQISTGLHPALADPAYLQRAGLLVLLGCIALDMGYALAGRRLGDHDEPEPPTRLPRPVPDSRLKWLSVLALLASAYYIQKVGGPGAFFTSRGGLAANFQAAGLGSAGSQASSALVVSLGQVPLVILFAAWTARILRRRERPIASLVWWAVMLAVNLVVNNPITNARYWFLTVAMGCLFCLPRLNRNGYRAVLLLGITAALIVFPYTDYYRYDPSGRAPLQTHSITETLSIKDYDQMTMTANGIWLVDHERGYFYGRQLLGDALFFVPRSQWDRKPIDTGVEIGRAVQQGTNFNLSSPLWIELWVDFSWPGLVIGFSALGFFARRFDDLFLRMRDGARGQVLLVDLVVPFVAGYEFILLRGPLLQAMSRLSVMIAIFWLLGERRRKDEPDGPAWRRALHHRFAKAVESSRVRGSR